MIIEVEPNIFWDTEKETQSEEAMEWLRTKVYAKRADVVPARDSYKRPYLWTIEMETCVVEIERIYLSSSSWAMDKEIVRVKA